MPMFDPETGEVLDRDALRSIQTNSGVSAPVTRVVDNGGNTKVRKRVDTNPNAQITHTEYKSGRVDVDVVAGNVVDDSRVFRPGERTET